MVLRVDEVHLPLSPLAPVSPGRAQQLESIRADRGDTYISAPCSPSGDALLRELADLATRLPRIRVFSRLPQGAGSLQ